MVDGAANLMSLFYAFLSTGQWKDQRHSNLLDGSAPFYRCYTCRDGGHVAVGALEPQFFAILLEGLGINADERSEEHTSELQSLMRISYAVFCLKKKNNHTITIPHCT